MHTEIVKQITSLPVVDRIEIIEEVTRSVRRDLQQRPLTEHERQRRSEAVSRLAGIASVPGRTPPTDEEWREQRTDYLLEKYK